MDRKIKLVAVASLVAVMASGCSSYRGASQAGYDSGSTATTGSGGYSTSGERRGMFGQRSRSNQVAGGGQVRGGGQSQRSNNSATCAPCGATPPKAQSTYTYKPAKPAAPAPQPKAQVSSTHNQQYYVDKWKREQAQAQQRAQQPKAQPQQNTNYAGYGANSNTQYYDYSSAGGNTTAPAANTNVSASNKSIYTGSYQQKTYKPYAPTTYSGGSAATTKTATYANTAGSSSSAGGSTYNVRKGDTVFEIMRQTGVYWKDIISLNNLQAPYNISPGQTLRLK